MVIFLFVMAVFGHAAAKYNYTVTVRTATIESQSSDLNLTVTMEGKGGNRITHVLRKQASVSEVLQLATRSERDCSWGSSMSSTGLGGTKLSQRTTKSYSYPSWMNGNTFAENVALCMEDCENNADCAGLQFSPTSWNHQECFLMSGSNTYSRSSWKTQLATCTVSVSTSSNAWRDDGRCGSSYTNDAGEAGECNPDDTNGYTCCSSYGWCGSSSAHCCASCVDYAVTTDVGASDYTNLALSGEAEQQDTYHSDGRGVAGLAIDGDTDGNYFNGHVSHTGSTNGWWSVSLAEEAYISHIDIYNRMDCCQDRLDGAIVYVDGVEIGVIEQVQGVQMSEIQVNRAGTDIMIVGTAGATLQLAEVEVYGAVVEEEETIGETIGEELTELNSRECEWSSAESNAALGGTKLSQRTTKSYSNPSWMNGNTFAENVALCEDECTIDSECEGLNFSPTTWDHQECFLMAGNNTYSRSSWSYSKATCAEEVDDDIDNSTISGGGRNEGIDVEIPIEVDTAGEDGFSSGSVDVFYMSDDVYLGTLLYVNISSGSDNAWQLDWMMVETEDLPGITRYVYNTETLHLSTDSSDDDNKAVDLLEMEVQGTEIYYLVIETANKTDAGSDSIHLKAIIHGANDAKTGYLDNEDRDDFVVGENDVFIVPGMRKAGNVQCITLLCWGDDSWEFDWIVVFSVKSYTQPPRVFWNNDTVLTTNGDEGVNEYYVCRNDNQWGSDELIELV